MIGGLLSFLISISIVSIGMFRRFVVVDEGHINFSHAYNLYHNGIFSFLPDKLADGTNEVLAMLLITPFAQNKESIFVAYFVLVWLALISCIFYVFRVVKNILPNYYESTELLVVLSLFGVVFLYHPVGMTISGGFVNILSTALFLATINSLLKSDYKKMSALAFLCAFSRVDSIAWLFAVFVADAIAKRKINWQFVISSLSGLFVLLLFFKLYYGHWIPTPIVLKSSVWFSWNVLQHRIYLLLPFVIITLPVLIILCKSKIFKNKFFILLLTFTFLGGMVIVLKDHNHQFSYYRYIIPFIFILLIAIIFVAGIVTKFVFLHFVKLQKIFLVLPLLFMFILVLKFYTKMNNIYSINKFVNKYERYKIGAFIPKNLSLMSALISQMFYARDNKAVIDSWGFSNLDIVKNVDRECYAEISIRTTEAEVRRYFNKLISRYNPDIVFVYEDIFSSNYNLYSYENIANNIGVNPYDIDEVNYIRDNYQIVNINHINSRSYFILVNNNKMQQFHDYIIAKGGIKKDFTYDNKIFVYSRKVICNNN